MYQKKRMYLWQVFAFLFLCLPMQIRALGDKDYKMKSQGEMPNTLQEIVKKGTKNRDYNSYLYQLLIYGEVVYGTESNAYLNRIAQNLLKSDEALANDIEIYITRSNAVNASMSDQGILLINMGLLAQVSNEAELAFIMAHEIGHFALHHQNTKESKNKKIKTLTEFLVYHNRSREMEFEADKYAIKLVAQSGYTLDASDGVFDVLLYSALPYDNLPFGKEEVENSYYHFSSKYYLKQIDPISIKENMLDTLSTHPNLARRREEVHANIDGMARKGAYFVQSETLFKQMQHQARFNGLELDLINHNYSTALYNSYIMLKEEPNNAFVQLVNAYCYYGLSKHKSHGNLSKAQQQYSSVMGEQKQVNYFINKISEPELNTLALKKCYALLLQQPENDFIKSVVKDLIKDLVQKNGLTFNSYLNYGMNATSPDSLLLAEQTEDENAVKQSNKYKSVKQSGKNAKSSKRNRIQTVNYMLAEYADDKELKQMFDACPLKEEQTILDKLEKQNYNNHSNLLILRPLVNLEHVKSSKQIQANQKFAIDCQKMSEHSAKRLHYNQPLKESQQEVQLTKGYNRNMTMNDWRFDYYASFNNKMIPFEMRNMRHELSTEDTTYIALISSSIHRYKLSAGEWFYNPIGFISYSVIVYPLLLPAAIAVNFIPQTDTQADFILVNPLTNELIYSKGIAYTESQSRAYVNSFLYECLYNIKKGGKK